jgi:hypothetical protein
MNSYKKIILTLIVAILGIGAANAQLRFGVKAGLNLNSLHFNSVSENFNSDNQCGWTAGVMTEFQIPLIGLCFDLSAMYTRMGSEPESAGQDYSIAKNFLEIPLNIKYKFGLPLVGNIIAPYLYTGPSFAFRLDKNTLNSFQSKTCQTAWNVGVGVELIKHLQIQGSYGFGMNNVSKIIGAVDPVTIKAKNNYWTVTAAYLF